MKRTITLIALVAALLIPSMASAQRMPAKSGMRLSQFKAPAAAPARAEEEPIMEAPEGTLYDNMYASSFAYGLGWGDIYIQNVDGGIGKVVEGRATTATCTSTIPSHRATSGSRSCPGSRLNRQATASMS